MVYFMDGPYAVEISKTTSGKLLFRALEGFARKSEVAIGEGSAISFTRRVISQSREALNECRRLEWWSKDAEILELSLAKMEQNERFRGTH